MFRQLITVDGTLFGLSTEGQVYYYVPDKDAGTKNKYNKGTWMAMPRAPDCTVCGHPWMRHDKFGVCMVDKCKCAPEETAYTYQASLENDVCSICAETKSNHRGENLLCPR